MNRLGRYWLFFVIVAVGLALSWGQVGRKTHRLFEAEPLVYLVNEPDCRPAVVPCAAVASDRALVLGPAAHGLVLKQAGLKTSKLVSGEAIFLATNGDEIGRQTLMSDAEAWSLADIPASARLLRVRIVGSHETTVGEFPLP